MDRRSTRSRRSAQKDSVLRKIREMSPTKKAKLGRVINRYNKTRKKLKQERLLREKNLRKMKKKFGKYSESYSDLTKTKKFPGNIAANILTMAKNMETYERQVKHQLEKSNREKEKLEKVLQSLKSQIIDSDDLIFLYSSPSERLKRISPEVLEQLTDERLAAEIEEEQERHREYEVKEKETIKELKKLNTKISAFVKKTRSFV